MFPIIRESQFQALDQNKNDLDLILKLARKKSQNPPRLFSRSSTEKGVLVSKET